MTAAEIAAALGGARRAGQWWRCVCPVHGSRTGRSLTLALRDNARCLALHCHAGCSRDDIIAELRRLGLIVGRVEHRSLLAAARNDAADDDARRIELARRIWTAAGDVRGTPVERYLAGRGITVPVPLSLRWAPSCRHPSGFFVPAMVAKVVNVDGELIGLHRTFLRPNGSGKADIEPQKAMLGRVAGGSVRLGPAAETLLVGEGIENCLSVMQATGLPCWSSLSASGLAALVLPSIVHEIGIVSDHDGNCAGQRAAGVAARRWRGEWRRVSVWISPHVGTDANDLLFALEAAGAQHAA
jgi:putative DNA primase/helicase